MSMLNIILVCILFYYFHKLIKSVELETSFFFFNITLYTLQRHGVRRT